MPKEEGWRVKRMGGQGARALGLSSLGLYWASGPLHAKQAVHTHAHTCTRTRAHMVTFSCMGGSLELEYRN